MTARLMFAALLVIPVRAQFPDGPGKAVFESLCNFCHAATFVVDKQLTKAEWQAIIDTMLQSQPASAEEKAAIVGYLAANYPRRVNVNQASADDLRQVLEITAAQAAAIVASRRPAVALKSLEDLKKFPGFTDAKLDQLRNRILF